MIHLKKLNVSKDTYNKVKDDFMYGLSTEDLIKKYNLTREVVEELLRYIFMYE